MRRYLFAVILLLSAVLSCREQNEQNIEHFTLDSFEATLLDSLSATRIDYCPDLLQPMHLRLAENGSIAIADIAQTQGMLLTFDQNTGRTKYAVTKGRGPEEMLTIFQLASKDSSLWVSCPSDRRVVRLSCNSCETFEMKDYFFKILPFRDSLFVALSGGFTGNRLDLRNPSGETLETFGTFPKLKNSPKLPPDNALFQSDITVSPDSRHIAVMCFDFEYVDIYDSSLNLTHRLSGPEGYEQEATLRNDSGYSAYVVNPGKAIFSNIVSDDNQLAVGYIGQKDGDTGYNRISTILVFDWDGNPLKSYNLDMDLMSFDIDWENDILYGLVADDEPYILKWQL